MIIGISQKQEELILPKEEMLEIIDFYLQYKPMLDENASNQEDYHPYVPEDFTKLLYMYKMLDVNYSNNMTLIKKKYENNTLKNCLKKN